MIGSYATVPVPPKKLHHARKALRKLFAEYEPNIFIDPEEPETFQIDYPADYITDEQRLSFDQIGARLINKYFRKYKRHI